jgi:hypothetical protein
MSIEIYRGDSKTVYAKVTRRLFDADWNLAPATRENITGASLVLVATDGTNTVEVAGVVTDADDGVARFELEPGHTMALPNQELRLPYRITMWGSAGTQEVLATGTMIVRTGAALDPYDPPAPVSLERIHESCALRAYIATSWSVPETIPAYVVASSNERFWPSSRRAIYRSAQWSWIPSSGAAWSGSDVTIAVQSVMRIDAELAEDGDWETLGSAQIQPGTQRGELLLGDTEVAAGHCMRVVFFVPGDFARSVNVIGSVAVHRVTLEA